MNQGSSSNDSVIILDTPEVSNDNPDSVIILNSIVVNHNSTEVGPRDTRDMSGADGIRGVAQPDESTGCSSSTPRSRWIHGHEESDEDDKPASPDNSFLDRFVSSTYHKGLWWKKYLLIKHQYFKGQRQPNYRRKRLLDQKLWLRSINRCRKRLSLQM